MGNRFIVEIFPFAECPECDGTGWLSHDDYQGVLPGIREGCPSVVCECSKVHLAEKIEVEK